jgi:glyoxylase-like metal-dependent hydrolase (beta-lactamase superfamily II)
MDFELQRLEVGPWPMNCYLLRCATTGQVAIIDPGADAELILDAVGDAQVCCILLTHAHPDHVGALDAVRQASGAKVGLHPADAEAFEVRADLSLVDGTHLLVGQGQATVVHVPGHTPGSVCLLLNGQAIVGDAVFPGGPGYTAASQDLAQSLDSLARTVFTWPDQTELYPGHGGHTTVGAERPAFEQFTAQELPPGLCGSVTWR